MRQVLLEKITLADSSLIDFLIYDYRNQYLEVRYKGGPNKGEQICYSNISLDDYNSIISAPSAGRALLSLVAMKKQASFFSRIKAAMF